MENVKISTDYIKLDQLLKWIGVADTGTAAKEMIAEGEIKVNGEVELRRGKKLRSGDRIDIGDNSFVIE